MRAPLVLFPLLLGCRSEAAPSPTPAPSASAADAGYLTTIVQGTMYDAGPVPDCTIHGVSDAFAPPSNAKPVGTIRIEGDYTRTLAKVSVDRLNSATWSGTFSGPRDTFFDMLRPHLCTVETAYALKAGDNKDPSRGAVVFTAYELTADEKGDVDALCHAVAHVGDAGAVDDRDRVAMQWATDRITSPKWDGWRRGFARSRTELYARHTDAAPLFHARAADLEAAAATYALKCPTAAEWKKR